MLADSKKYYDIYLIEKHKNYKYLIDKNYLIQPTNYNYKLSN